MASKFAHTADRTRRRIIRPAIVILLAIVLVLVIGRLLLPGFVRERVNSVLAQSEQFDGSVGEVDIHLWRGAYSVHNVKIVKTELSVPTPFFEARRVDFSIDWPSLFHGKVRGRVMFDHPMLNFVDGPTERETQTGRDEPWLAMIEQLFPFEIDEAKIVDGTIAFHAYHVEPEVNIYLTDVQATINNLTNVLETLDPKMASVRAEAIAMHSGRLKVDIQLDPFSYRPTFDLALQLLDLDVTELDSLTRAYGAFDFEQGQFDLIVEATAQNGYFDGYAKPLFRNLVIASRADWEHDDPLQAFWETLVGVVEELFQNQSREQFGTRITLQGELDNPRMNIFEVIGNILYNAFIRAYLPRFESGTAPRPAEGVS